MKLGTGCESWRGLLRQGNGKGRIMNLRVILYCLVGGICFMTPWLSSAHSGWALPAGLLVAVAFVPFARCGPSGWLKQFGAIVLALVVVGLVCTLTEGMLFVPEVKSQIGMMLGGGTLFYVVAAAVLATLSRLLKLTEPGGEQVAHRTGLMAVAMLAVSGIAYAVYYFVFGSIAFQAYTKQFYPHAVEQAAAMGVWFWVYQFGRGLIMTAAVLPVIYHLRLPRWQAALAVGALLWIVGGGAALLVPSPTFVTAQRYAHILEIMTQNVSLGVTAVWLLRPKATMAPESFQAATAAK